MTSIAVCLALVAVCEAIVAVAMWQVGKGLKALLPRE